MKKLYLIIFCNILLFCTYQTKSQSILKDRNYPSTSYSINELSKLCSMGYVNTLEHYNSVLCKFKTNALISDWNNFEISSVNAGIEVSIDYKNDFWGNISGGINKKPAYVGLLSPALDIDLDKILSWQAAKLYLSIHGTFGSNFNDWVGSIQGVDNIEAYDTWKIYEFWIEQGLFKNSLSLRFGLYDLNSEFDVQETSLVFLNPSQGIGPDFSLTGKNGPSIFPTTSLALRIKYQPNSGYYAQAAIFDGVPGDPKNPSGNHIIINKNNGALLTAEAGFMRRENSSNKGYEKYGIGCWYYTSKFELHNSNNIKKMHKGNFGFYAFAEKEIYQETLDKEQGLSAFLRIGYAEDNLNKIDGYLGTGLVYKGLFNNRNQDVLGIAVAIAHTSNWYWQELKVSNYDLGRSEIDCELTYSMYLLKWLNLQPDLQYLFNPLNNKESKHVYITGLRTTLTF